MTDLANRKLTIIGLGKLGGILLDAFLDKGLVERTNVNATVHHQRRADALAAGRAGGRPGQA